MKIKREEERGRNSIKNIGSNRKGARKKMYKYLLIAKKSLFIRN